MNLPSTRVQRVLILFPRQIGDVLLATNIATVLKDMWLQVTVGWCAHKMCEQVLVGHKDIDVCFLLPKRKKGKNFFQNVLYFFQHAYQEWLTLHQLRKFHPDVAKFP